MITFHVENREQEKIIHQSFIRMLPAVNYYHKERQLGCCSSPRSASVNTGITFIHHFSADLFLILSDIDTANFTNDTTPHVSGKNVDDVIESLQQASLSLFK